MWLGVTFFTVMRAILVAAEGAVAVVLYFLMTRFAPAREVRRILLVGICFNPIAILFSVQHENIDVFVGLSVVLALWALVSAERARDAAGWLAGSLALGLGVFVKTVPLALMPLLAPGMRTASKLGRTLALALFFGPVVLSLAVVVVFGPHAVLDNVLGYRSFSGFFGITGLLDLAHLHGVTRVYAASSRSCSSPAWRCSSACSGTGAWTRSGRSCSPGSCSPRFLRSGPATRRSMPTGSCRRSSRATPCSTTGGGGFSWCATPSPL